MFSVATNLLAMNAQRQFNINTSSKAKSTEKLSSGYRINRAADDVAGLAISEKMRRQINGFNQGTKNIHQYIENAHLQNGYMDNILAIYCKYLH